MFAIIGWLLMGLLAGAMARLLVRGPQPMGLFMTMILGLAGSLVGGFISSLIFNYDPTTPVIHASGLIMSIIGAMLVLAICMNSSSRALR